MALTRDGKSLLVGRLDGTTSVLSLADRGAATAKAVPLAGVMARMAGTSPWCEQASTPHALRPVYVRRHYADRARAKQQTATAGGAPPDAHPTPGPPAAE